MEHILKVPGKHREALGVLIVETRKTYSTHKLNKMNYRGAHIIPMCNT